MAMIDDETSLATLLKGIALVATFIGFLTIFAMWVSLWDNVWRVSVEPTRGAIYDASLAARNGGQSSIVATTESSGRMWA
jgi:hypothetical protein